MIHKMNFSFVVTQSFFGLCLQSCEMMKKEEFAKNREAAIDMRDMPYNFLKGLLIE